MAASMAPSAAPAPTMVCSSSMNRIIFPPTTSSSTALIRSSKSPRYFAPASMAVRSTDTMCFPCSASGTRPCWNNRASPSTMAVFPTPASPTRQGLFLLRRARIRIRRSTSFSLPMRGSRTAPSPGSVSTLPYFNKVGYRFRSSMRMPLSSPLPHAAHAFAACSVRTERSASRSRKIPQAVQFSCSSMARSRCSEPISREPDFCNSFSAPCITRRSAGV